MNRTKINKQANRELKKLFIEKEINYCEADVSILCINSWLTFAHRHKRRFYYNKPELLKDFKQVILSCINCHQILEGDKVLTETTFMRLRGDE
jgi:hypothetical protein